MVAFEITINGKPYCESEDITVLTMVVEEIQRRGGQRISFARQRRERRAVAVLAANLGVGDEIVVRIVEASEGAESGPPGCAFCGREIHDAHTLVVGQSKGICDLCIAGFSEAVKHGTELPLGASIRDEPQWVCDFCASLPGTIRASSCGTARAVCPECLRAAA